ncbi:MAG: hypothetical protein R3Y09_02440 [Clostridia bacterium]
MSENKFNFSVESIIAEIGIDEKYKRKTSDKEYIDDEFETPDVEIREEYSFVNTSVDDYDNYANISKKLKKQSNLFENKAKIVLFLLILSVYLTISAISNVPMIDYLNLINYPYIYMLANVALHIFAIIVSVDVISDGFSSVLSPNTNTLVSFSSFFILLHTLSVIFLKNPLAFLPYTAVSIFTLYCSLKSMKYDSRAKSFVYRICSMSSRLAFVCRDESKRRKFSLKKPTMNKQNFAKNVETREKNLFFTIYFYFYLIFMVTFSIYVSNGSLAMFVWSAASISAIAVPINYIFSWSLPYKYAAKKLFDDGIAIKSYEDIKKMPQNDSIIISDRDLFPENSVSIEQMELYARFTENEVFSYVACGFSKLNSCARPTFEYELKKRYLRPLKCQKMDLIDENGFTFTANNKKISIGNAKFVTNLGLTVFEGYDVTNPIYVVISSQIASIISIKHNASPKMYHAISTLEQNSIKLIISTLDFTISSNLIARVYDLPNKSVIFDDFLTRYNQIQDEKDLNESILLARQSGRTYIRAFIAARKLAWSVKLNMFLGTVCSLFGFSVVGYLLYNFSPTVLLPQNILLFLFFWSLPSVIISFFYNNI